MESSFYDLASCVRLVQLTDGSSNSNALNALNALNAALKDFEKYINKHKDDTYLLSAFKDVHHDEMSRIVFYLRSQSKTISKNVLKFTNHVPRRVTRVFDEFIKGIYSDNLIMLHLDVRI